GEAMDKDVIPYLRLMVERNASDLVFSVGTVPHMKLEGVTWPLKAPVLEPGDVKELAYGIMTRKQIAAFEATFEMNLALSVNDIGRFRVNVYQQRGDVAMAVRYIKAKIPGFGELSLPSLLKDLVMLKRGLV